MSDVTAIKILEHLETIEGDHKGGDLTLDEVKELTKMFASQKTCEEREKAFNSAVDRLSKAAESLAEATQEDREHNLLMDIRVSAIEDHHVMQQKRVKTKIAVVGIAITFMSHADKIFAFIKEAIS